MLGPSALAASVRADEVEVDARLEDDMGKSREGSRTDDEVVQRSASWPAGSLWWCWVRGGGWVPNFLTHGA